MSLLQNACCFCLILYLAIYLAFFVYQEFIDWRVKVFSRIRAKLLERKPLDEETLYRQFAASVDVPREFLSVFIESISSSYGVPVGHVLPTDRFDVELSVPTQSLPKRLARKLKSESTDGENLAEFAWEWYGDHAVHVPQEALQKLAKRTDLSVAELCMELYQLELKHGKLKTRPTGPGEQ